jgi:hypothetical protein
VLTDLQGQHAQRRDLAVVAVRVVDELDRAAAQLDLAKRLHMRQLRVAQQVVVGVDGRPPDAAAVEPLGQLGDGEERRRAGQPPRILVALHIAVDVRHLAQRAAFERVGKHRAVAERDHHVAVTRRVDPIGGRVEPGGEMLVALQHLAGLAGSEVVDQRLALQVDRRIDEARLDPCTLAAAQPAHQGAQDAHGQQRAAMLVDDGRPDRRRPMTGRAGDAHQAGAGLGEQVLAGLLRQGSGRAEAAGRGEDEIGIDLVERRLVEAELGEHPGAEVLHDHIGAGDQPACHRLALGVLEVDPDRALVAVGAEIEAAHAFNIDVGARPAPLMRAFQGLDLDDVRAHVGKVLRTRRALQEMAEADNPDAVEQHFSSP